MLALSFSGFDPQRTPFVILNGVHRGAELRSCIWSVQRAGNIPNGRLLADWPTPQLRHEDFASSTPDICVRNSRFKTFP